MDILTQSCLPFKFTMQKISKKVDMILSRHSKLVQFRFNFLYCKLKEMMTLLGCAFKAVYSLTSHNFSKSMR